MPSQDPENFRRFAESLNSGPLSLVGFDPAPPSEAISAALKPSTKHYEWQGILVLDIKGKRTCLVLQTDPDDGYRSTLAPVILNEDLTDHCILQFTHAPIPVKATCPTPAIISLIDEDDHEWMTFGTFEHESYYPESIFKWDPKKR